LEKSSRLEEHIQQQPALAVLFPFFRHVNGVRIMECALSHSEGEGALMDGAACPTEQVLSLYILGKLSHRDFCAVAGHVESCARCDSITETLECTPDPLLQKLRRSQRAEDYVGEPELWSALLQLHDSGGGSIDANCASSV
jgi:hypothetical protein